MESEKSEGKLPLQLHKGQTATEMAGIVMEVTSKAIEKLCKIAKGLSKKGNSGPDKFADMIQREIGPELAELWADCVAWSNTTATAFADGRKAWKEEVEG